MAKKDKELGLKVKEHLISIGAETPIDDKVINYSPQERIDMIESKFSDIMYALGLDLKDDSLKNTPNRVAKMYVNEFFKGLNYDNFPACSEFSNKMGCDEMVVIDKIKVKSVCEHHFVAIDGFAKVGYIPNNTVLGLSKFNRVVDFFSRRPQVQERLGIQIAEALKVILGTQDVALIIKAEHHCVKCRGVQDDNSITTTSKISGKFREGIVRNEFLNL